MAQRMRSRDVKPMPILLIMPTYLVGNDFFYESTSQLLRNNNM
jgi:hypothetical protein